MEIKIVNRSSDGVNSNEGWIVTDDGSATLSHMGVGTRLSRLYGSLVPTLTVGGVGTPPPCRRHGYVRMMFDELGRVAPQRGWTVGLLHPFSFAYYRKFGYEKVSDHVILEFPMEALAFADRCPDFVEVNGDSRLPDLIAVYEKFAEKRNIMFPRRGGGLFPLKPSGGKTAYLWYDASGAPAAYVIVGVEDYYDINRMNGVNLHVYEMVYTSPEALYAALGFLRMYEGQLANVVLHDIGMEPEVDFVLRHYTHTHYRFVPDIAARIYDVPAALKAQRYPDGKGHFSLKLADDLPYAAGVYDVQYEDGKAEVTRRADGSADCELPAPAFAQLVYGYSDYTPDNFAYLPGAKLYNASSDLFRVFRRGVNGLFEHF